MRGASSQCFQRCQPLCLFARILALSRRHHRGLLGLQGFKSLHARARLQWVRVLGQAAAGDKGKNREVHGPAHGGLDWQRKDKFEKAEDS
jgi:hypothetical protein